MQKLGLKKDIEVLEQKVFLKTIISIQFTRKVKYLK